jgi:hypothetical protein
MNKVEEIFKLYIDEKSSNKDIFSEIIQKSDFSFNLKYGERSKNESLFIDHNVSKILNDFQIFIYDLISINKYNLINKLNEEEKQRYKVIYYLENGCVKINDKTIQKILEQKWSLFFIFVIFIVLYQGIPALSNIFIEKEKTKQIKISTETEIIKKCIEKMVINNEISKCQEKSLNILNDYQNKTIKNLKSISNIEYQKKIYNLQELEWLESNNLKIQQKIKDNKKEEIHIVDIKIIKAVVNKPSKKRTKIIWTGNVNISNFIFQISFEMKDVDFQNNTYNNTIKPDTINCLIKIEFNGENNKPKYYCESVYKINNEIIKDIPENILEPNNSNNSSRIKQKIDLFNFEILTKK